ncbi:hypothetical protein DFH11DRAFT_576855 [Phellopilus nigrolimitatus]|nr:hypothetical protein DFH11DRAFT_576855 [Phellopilus nigrolimitatus]
MESASRASSRVATLPPPPLKRKSPPSPVSATTTTSTSTSSSTTSTTAAATAPSEILGALALGAQPKSKGSPPAPARASASPGAQTPSADDYENGLAVCGTCGEGVPFRDPRSGGFTLRLWDLHREQCRSQHAPAQAQAQAAAAPGGEPLVFAPEATAASMVSAHAHAHHAHANAAGPLKKRRAKRTEDERIEYLRTDPHVAQFEAYRVLCGSCAKWIRLRPNSTYCSIPWDAHRKSCLSKKAVLPMESRQANDPGLVSPGRPAAAARPHPPSPRADGGTSSAHPPIRADPLLREVEPNRVFCGVCAKWVQLRQDSSFCAYPWHQHRGKCLAKYRRLQEKNRPYLPGGAHVPHAYRLSAAVGYGGHAYDVEMDSEDPDDDGDGEGEGESDGEGEGDGDGGVEGDGDGDVDMDDEEALAPSRDRRERERERWEGAGRAHGGAPYPHVHAAAHTREREHSQSGRRGYAGAPPPSLADLGSPGGRLAFIAASIRHLFGTTYARGADALSVGALVNYLNAALPPDKHEEFDVREVSAACGGALAKAGRVVLRGDEVRLRE